MGILDKALKTVKNVGDSLAESGVILGIVIFNTIYANVVFWEGVHERQRKSNH